MEGKQKNLRVEPIEKKQKVEYNRNQILANTKANNQRQQHTKNKKGKNEAKKDREKKLTVQELQQKMEGDHISRIYKLRDELDSNKTSEEAIKTLKKSRQKEVTVKRRQNAIKAYETSLGIGEDR